MARSPTPEQQAEYEALNRYVTGIFDFLVSRGRLSPDTRALFSEGRAAIEARGWSAALRGMRMAAADTLEMTRDLPRDVVAEADEFLKSRSAATVSLMRVRIWRQIPKILTRGRIRNEEEYYLLVEQLNDVSTTSLSEADRARAERMIAAYEAARASSG
jgi:hypothetical protein